MRIIIDGQEAELKENISFEYNFENRLFEGRDAYTLALTFPLRDCHANRRIFGHIERIDIAKEKVFYECEIQCSMFSAQGSILITGVSESEVKAQFVEGRCEQTSIDPFEDIYINELYLGFYPNSGSFTPEEAWRGSEEVALPWINNEYPTQFNNWVRYTDGRYIWSNVSSSSAASRGGSGASSTHRPTGDTAISVESANAQSLSWQPYLIAIAKRICEACNYEYDFTDWEASPLRYLLICNTLPSTWNRQYKDILPHWTVTEFFEKLELLMMCEFNIDHRLRRVDFRFTLDALEDIHPVNIDNVVDEYSVDIANDQQGCSYIGAKRLMYKECSHELQPFYACDWFLDGASVREYDTLSELIERNKRHMLEDINGIWPVYGEFGTLMTLRTTMVVNDVNHVLYARDVNKYYVMRSIGTEFIQGYRPGGYAQIYVLQAINSFGSGMPESEDTEDEQIDFVPVCINDTYIDADDDMGYMMQLSFGSYEDDSEYAEVGDESSIRQPMSTSALIAGEKDKGSEYYDVIYVGLWDGTPPSDGKSPHPHIDDVFVDQDWTIHENHLPNLRIVTRMASLRDVIKKINPKQKFKYSFFADKLPNPRAEFFIKGKRYLCEKITAPFTKDGMSQLLKGEFYAISD